MQLVYGLEVTAEIEVIKAQPEPEDDSVDEEDEDE